MGKINNIMEICDSVFFKSKIFIYPGKFLQTFQNEEKVYIYTYSYKGFDLIIKISEKGEIQWKDDFNKCFSTITILNIENIVTEYINKVNCYEDFLNFYKSEIENNEIGLKFKIFIDSEIIYIRNEMKDSFLVYIPEILEKDMLEKTKKNLLIWFLDKL